ncbi:hypothetical protein ACOMHN_048105 [Nucella lapillus]
MNGAHLPMQKCSRKLLTYTGQEIPVLGVCRVVVKYEDSTSLTLEVIVVKYEGPSLLGRDWLKFVRLDWSEIFPLRSKDSAYL